MGYELGWRLIEHPGLRTAFCGFVFDTVNTAAPNVLFEFVLFDNTKNEGLALVAKVIPLGEEVAVFVVLK